MCYTSTQKKLIELNPSSPSIQAAPHQSQYLSAFHSPSSPPPEVTNWQMAVVSCRTLPPPSCTPCTPCPLWTIHCLRQHCLHPPSDTGTPALPRSPAAAHNTLRAVAVAHTAPDPFADLDRDLVPCDNLATLTSLVSMTLHRSGERDRTPSTSCDPRTLRRRRGREAKEMVTLQK